MIPLASPLIPTFGALAKFIPTKTLVAGTALASANKRGILPFAKYAATKISTGLGLLTEKEAKEQEKIFDRGVSGFNKIVTEFEDEVKTILLGDWSAGLDYLFKKSDAQTAVEPIAPLPASTTDKGLGKTGLQNSINLTSIKDAKAYIKAPIPKTDSGDQKAINYMNYGSVNQPNDIPGVAIKVDTNLVKALQIDGAPQSSFTIAQPPSTRNPL